VKSLIDKRLAAGLTQKELADKIGTRQSVISNLEGGEANPTLATLHKVAAALGAKGLVTLQKYRRHHNVTLDCLSVDIVQDCTGNRHSLSLITKTIVTVFSSPSPFLRVATWQSTSVLYFGLSTPPGNLNF